MADSQYVVEQLWAKIGARLAETAAPEGGWPLDTLASGVQSAIGHANTSHSAVSTAVSELGPANAGKLLRVGASGSITVPDPASATDPTPQGWVNSEISRRLSDFAAEIGTVSSVNGKAGDVTLTAADVGARPAGTPLAISDTSGLQSALDAKATTAALSALDGAIAGRIGTAVGAATTPINNDISTLQGRVGTAESDIDALESRSRPAGGWRKADLDGTLVYRIEQVEGATSLATAETIVSRNSAGTFQVGSPTAQSHPATKKYVDDSLSSKAEAASLTALDTLVATKADSSTVTSLSGNVSSLTTRMTAAEASLEKKVELGTSGTFPESHIPALPISRITSLQSELDTKPTLSGGKVALSTIPSGIPQSSISGLSASFTAKADLVGGKVPTSQIPAIATHETYPVASKAAMLALTTSQVQVGDVAIITTAGNDQGTYTLVNADPSKEASWIRHQAPQDAVLSVNGKQGTVVLSASDVGARALGGTIVQDDVTGLTSALNSRTTKAYVDTELAKKTTPSDVSAIASTLGSNKQAVDLVATSNQLTLSGLKSVDGVLMQAGQRVLLTAQQASSANGIYVVGTGEWSRGSDMPNGSTVIPGTAVMVRSGADHAQSIWQMTTTSPATVGTNSQQWVKAYAGKEPVTYTASNGLQLDGSVFSVRLGASSGLISDSAGLRLDPSSAVRKVTLTVGPAGFTSISLSHNLGTSDISVTFIDNATQEAVLVPWVVMNSNSISCEFANPVTANAYRAVIIG